MTRELLAARKAVRRSVGGAAEVVVGLSGGADSLALAVAVAEEVRAGSLAARAVVVDHQLQEGSGTVAARAAEHAEGLGLPARVVRVEVGTEGGMEAAARDARREALLAAAGPGVPILLAHTRDDQAETVLLGLGRGAGARSLSGMAPLDGPWHRPFLELTREDTEAICTQTGLTWWDDPHNEQPQFRRVRVRHEVLPMLEDVLGGGVRDALARTAEHLRRDNEALDQLAADEHTDDVEQLARLHPAVRTRILRRLALDAGALSGELSAVHLAEMDRLVTSWRGQQRIELPGHLNVRRDGNRLVFDSRPVGP